MLMTSMTSARLSSERARTSMRMAQARFLLGRDQPALYPRPASTSDRMELLMSARSALFASGLEKLTTPARL